jgi:DNA-binding response OmpR family regulator
VSELGQIRAGETALGRILIVEDEAELGAVVARHLETEGSSVLVVGSGERGVEVLQEERFDLVLLDIMLPGMNGLEMCRWMRSHRILTPVIMLTARASEIDKVLGLETGADDYLTKPFSLKELAARVRAMLRRTNPAEFAHGLENGLLRVGDWLVVDPASRETHVGGQPVDLTQKEFDLLLHFMRNPNRVFSRDQLLDTVWGYSHDAYQHAVNCHINRLRAKIERDPGKPELIATVWGVGYKFVHPTQ